MTEFLTNTANAIINDWISNPTAQAIGFVALVCSILSFQFGKGKRFFFFQVLLCVLFSVHFLLLREISGFLLNFWGAVTYGVYYYKSLGKKFAQSEGWLLLFCTAYLLCGVYSAVTKGSIIELLPAAAMILNAITRFSGDLLCIRLSQLIVSSPIWCFYDYLVGSQAGVINEFLAFGSAFIGILRYKEELKYVILSAYGKINLSLSVGDKNEKGYHNLKSVMQSVSIKDRVFIRKSNTVNVISFLSPFGKRNITYRAASYFKDYGGAFIFLRKKIPLLAGLGGGSADAAAVLIGMNKLYGEPYTSEQLLKFAHELGSDVPFMLSGGTAKVLGTGEQIESLPFYESDIVVVKDGKKASTGAMYARLDENGLIERGDEFERFIKSLENGGDISPFNDFETVFDCRMQKADIEAAGGKAGLSGSGPSVFGIFENKEKARDAQKRLSKKYKQVYLCHTVPNCVTFE